MEIIYAVDMKLDNHLGEYEHTLAMDISCRNILAFAFPYLSPSPTQMQKHRSNSFPTRSTEKPSEFSFGVYICPLEQPWQVHEIAKWHIPITQIAWDRDGKFLLICNEQGICHIYQMDNNCINLMELIYEHDAKEQIILARCFAQKEPIVMHCDKPDLSFFNNHSDDTFQFPLPNHFICVSTSGTIHTFPLEHLSSTSTYHLSSEEFLSASLADLTIIDQGFNLFLSERLSGASVQCFTVRYVVVGPRLSYASVRDRGFRVPSCHGQLRSLVAFQRNGMNCVLVHLRSPTGDTIDLYEYNLNQADWVYLTLVNSTSTVHVTSMALSPSQWLMKENDYLALFARQILMTMSDGLIIAFDKLNLACREQSYPLDNFSVFQEKSEFFVRIQHTPSGSCCLGFTQSGVLVLLRTLDLALLSSPSICSIVVGLLEQYIVQQPYPCDIWDILCLIPTSDPNQSTINIIIDRLVQHFNNENLDFQRRYFPRFKECLFHLYRLINPSSIASSEHLVTLLIYYSLVIVRDYARRHVSESSKRNLMDIAQEMLQQASWTQNLDVNQFKYVSDQSDSQQVMNGDDYQITPWIGLVNWVSDILFYFISYLRSRHVPLWLPCSSIFHDSHQIQWLKELMIYFSILNKMNKIPLSKVSQLQRHDIPNNAAPDSTQDTWKDIYQNITNYCHRVEVQPQSLFDDFTLDNLVNLDIDRLEAYIDCLFPISHPCLLPNSSQPQTFIRHRPPFSQADHLCGASATNLSKMNEPSRPSEQIHQPSHQENPQTMKFDILDFTTLSLSLTSNFRRCIRCGNVTRLLKTKPYPFLFYYLNDRCLCGGLFLHYSR